uniref:Uncharacterized protein n=1 Tax=Sipha flava TaxID=143950 RepID=A0A2S2PZJ9_9HEMI
MNFTRATSFSRRPPPVDTPSGGHDDRNGFAQRILRRRRRQTGCFVCCIMVRTRLPPWLTGRRSRFPPVDLSTPPAQTLTDLYFSSFRKYRCVFSLSHSLCPPSFSHPTSSCALL